MGWPTEQRQLRPGAAVLHMRWRVALGGIAVTALLAGLALVCWPAASWPSSDDAYRGTPPEIPRAVDKSLGINADLAEYDERSLDLVLTTLESVGIRWLRHRFPWELIEPSQGEYSWTTWDRIVGAVTRHNMSLVAVLDGSPAWAREDDEQAGSSHGPPAQAEMFGAFARAFAVRYGEWIDHYQLWDEPNIAPHWGSREVSPQEYARLLREGSIQIRTADTGAVILAAALAPNVEPGGANMSDLTYLDALYRAGAAEWFDVVAAQPYGFGMPLDAPPQAGVLTWTRVALLRNIMVQYGDEQTAVWAVSFGLLESQYGGTDAGLAEALQTVVTGARDDWPWMGPMLWAAWDSAEPHGEYALAEGTDLSAAVGSALATMAAEGASTAWPGVYQADHASGAYQGSWRITPVGADIGRSGDRLTISFHGTRLDIHVRRGDYRAFLFVEVDGRPTDALPRDLEGRAYVVLYDPLQSGAAVTVARGLAPGDHTAEIVAERGWGQWSLDGWTVSNEADRPPAWPAALLAVSGLVALSTGLWLASKGDWTRRLGTHLMALDRQLVRLRDLDFRLLLAVTAAVATLTYAMGGGLPSLVGIWILFLLLCLRPDVGLPTIAMALPFYQLGVPLLGKTFSIVEILVLLTTAGWILWRIPGGKVRFAGWKQAGSRFTSLDLGVGLLVLIAAASLIWAEHTRVALREFRTVVLEAALFYGLVRAMVRRRQDAWQVVDAWIVGATAIALIGIWQWVFGQNIVSAEGVWRVRGFYGSPNNLALYLGRLLPLGLAVALWSQSSSRRIWYGLASLALAAAIGLTYSRGALLLGVPASVLFLVFFRPRRRRLSRYVLVVSLLIAVAVMSLAGTGRLGTLLDTSEGTTFFRLQLWKSSWTMVKDHPLLGVGLDNFLYYYRTHYVLPTAWEEFDLSHPHNFVLDFWLRLGLAGLLALGWTLASFFRTGGLARGRWLPEEVRLLAVGLLAGMVSFLAHGLVDNAFFLVDLAFCFMLAAALVQVDVTTQSKSRLFWVNRRV